MCGCCTGVTQLTPVAIANRPALAAIGYRVGVYATFLASMEAALSGSAVPALAGLRTRSSGDFSIALIDAWSEVLDILTFYTERLANEAYLGTAIEARSVFELARLVGYKPSPGVSASTVLAFTLATATGSPAIVPIAAGTRVQSVPGPGQTPQVFETATALTATIAGNAIPAATSQPWQLNGGDTSTWIAGTANNIQVGNVLLFLSTSNNMPSASSQAALCFVTSVTIDSASGNTLITWDQQLPSGFTQGQSNVCLYVFRTKAALYGANAPWPGMFASTTLLEHSARRSLSRRGLEVAVHLGQSHRQSRQFVFGPQSHVLERQSRSGDAAMGRHDRRGHGRHLRDCVGHRVEPRALRAHGEDLAVDDGIKRN